MKKRLKLAGIILVILVIGSLIWWFVPAHLCSIDAQQVEKIQIFDGNRGVKFEISDSGDIDYLINSWDQVSMKKEKIILAGMGGFKFNVTVCFKSGKTEQFTINTEDVVKKEILVYRRVKGDVCYEYIDTLAENAR